MLPRFRRGAFALFLVTFVVTMLLGDREIGPELLLAPAGVAKGQAFWQLVSAPFCYPEWALAGLASTLVVQWTLGSRLEEFWGTTRYVALVVGSALMGMLGTVGVAVAWPTVLGDLPIGGAAVMDIATATAFVFVLGRQRFWPLQTTEVTGRVIGLFALGIVTGLSLLWAARATEAWTAAWPTLCPLGFAALVTILVVTQPWRTSRNSGKVRDGNARNRSHLRIVRSADDLLN